MILNETWFFEQIKGEKMDTTPSFFTFLIPLLLGGVFAVLGIGLLFFGLRDRKKAKAAEAWPTVNGVIVSSRLDQNTRTGRRDGRAYTHITYARSLNTLMKLVEKLIRGTISSQVRP